jgi:hypothetical protein
MSANAKFSVRVHARGLPGNAKRWVAGMRLAAEVQGARQITVSVSDDGTEIEGVFLVDARDEDAATKIGFAILSAVEAGEFVCTVGVWAVNQRARDDRPVA